MSWQSALLSYHLHGGTTFDYETFSSYKSLSLSLSVSLSLSLSLSQYNHHYDAVVSGDESGMMEYWSGPANDYVFPKNIKFEHKIDTDLYDFAKVG